jgi:hypothetical protein
MSSSNPRIARRRLEKNRKRQKRLKRKEAQPPLGSQSALAEWDGIEKMSVVLEKFIEPYKNMAADEQQFRNLLNLGAVAWNVALLPEDRRMAAIDAFFSKYQTPGEHRKFARLLLQELIDRKEAHFSTNRRSIVDFVLTDTGDGYHLNVVSTFPNEPALSEFDLGGFGLLSG